MYWKKKPSQSTGSFNFRNQPSLENEHGLLASGSEMCNRKPLPTTPRTQTSVETTALNKEKDTDGPLYECTDPMDGYVKMS